MNQSQINLVGLLCCVGFTLLCGCREDPMAKYKNTLTPQAEEFVVEAENVEKLDIVWLDVAGMS